MFVFVKDDEDDDDHSVDDRLMFQTDRFGVPRLALSEIESSIEFNDNKRGIKREHVSNYGLFNNQFLEVYLIVPSPELDDFAIKKCQHLIALS